MPPDQLPAPRSSDPCHEGAAPSAAAPVVQVWARDGARTELSPGALDRLRLLGVGRSIELIRADGRRDRWRVAAIEPTDGPAAQDVITVDDARGEVTLLVCGGAYLPLAGGYERPLVLRCVPAGSSPAAAA